VTLAEVRGARPVKRRFLPDLYEFTMADGSTCRIAAKTSKNWTPTIRRLLTERHGLNVYDDGDHWWRVE
jgi:hypothetical protein